MLLLLPHSRYKNNCIGNRWTFFFDEFDIVWRYYSNKISIDHRYNSISEEQYTPLHKRYTSFYTCTRNTFAPFLVSIENSDNLSFSYNLSNNNASNLCQLLRAEECIFDSVLSKCGIIRHTVVKGNNTVSILKDNWRSFLIEYELNNIKIETSKVTNVEDNSRISISSLIIEKMTLNSFQKASTQSKVKSPSPYVRIWHFLYFFNLLPYIYIYILESIDWADKQPSKMTSNSWSLNNHTKIISYKSISISSNNIKASNYQSKYSILDMLGFVTSSVQGNCIDTIRLQNQIKKLYTFSKITMHKWILKIGMVIVTKS